MQAQALIRRELDQFHFIRRQLASDSILRSMPRIRPRVVSPCIARSSAASEKPRMTFGLTRYSEIRNQFAYLQSEFREQQAKLPPDGRWLAYRSDESKRDEIFVASFPAPGGKWPISTNGGTSPVWSRDGTSTSVETAAS